MWAHFHNINARHLQIKSTKKSLETKSRSRQLATRAWNPNSRVHEQSKFPAEIPGLWTPRTNRARTNGIHDPNVLLNIDMRKSIHHGTKTVQDPNIMEARFRKGFIIQEHSLLKITGNITDDGTVVFFAIAESGPVSKGSNAIKNGFRQMARESTPLSTKKKTVKRFATNWLPSNRERTVAKCS